MFKILSYFSKKKFEETVGRFKLYRDTIKTAIPLASYKDCPLMLEIEILIRSCREYDAYGKEAVKHLNSRIDELGLKYKPMFGRVCTNSVSGISNPKK